MGRRPGRWGELLLGVACVAAVCALLAFLPGRAGDQFRRVAHLNDHRVGSAVHTSATGAYAFERTQPGSGTPVSYNPCEKIHYVINPDGGPADYLSFIEPAVSEASRLSGFVFVYDGTTRDRTFKRISGPVLIGFARPDELSQLPESGDAVGLGGSTAVGPAGGFLQYRTGMVALKADWFRQQDAHGRVADEQAVVMHELGHVLGLGHVSDPTELMNPTIVSETYGPGDIEGLAKLGAVRCG